MRSTPRPAPWLGKSAVLLGKGRMELAHIYAKVLSGRQNNAKVLSEVPGHR